MPLYSFIPNPLICAGYYQCYEDRLVEGTCPDGFLFNFAEQICDFSNNVDCEDIIPPSSPGTPPPTSESTTQEVTTQEATTEAATTEEETTEEKTSEEPTTTVEPTTTQPPLVNCPSGQAIYLPHPQRCSQYFLCFNGVPTPKKCATNYHFNEERQTCLSREKADCRIEDPVCPEIDDPFNPIFHSNPHYCDRYYLCFNGSLQPFYCDEGDHWDSVNEYCVDPEEALCESSFDGEIMGETEDEIGAELLLMNLLLNY